MPYILLSKSKECLPLSLLIVVFRERREAKCFNLDDEFSPGNVFEDVAFEYVATMSSSRLRFTVAGVPLLFLKIST